MTDDGATAVPARFDPADHASLRDLGERLRELAGDAAFAAGRDYLRKGLVRHGTVAGTTAHATVAGSTDYRISIAFPPDLAEPQVSCTCPAHRRNKHCKHVVAVVAGLLERPGEFGPVAPTELPAETTKPKRARSTKGAGGGRSGGTAKERAAVERAEQQTAGLAVVDRLLEELAAGGSSSLGSEGAALLTEAAETVRGLKLRRLGNNLMALRRLAAATGSTAGTTGFRLTTAMRRAMAAGDGQTDASARFAALLTDIALVRQSLGAHATGRVTLDPALAEDLLGKTWRDSDLERVAGLDLVPLGEDRSDDGEFRVETGYLLDLGGGELYVEKQISPVALRSAAPKPPRRLRLAVDEAGLYPGESPRRIKLIRVRREPLTAGDVDRLLGRAVEDVPSLRARLVDRLRSPFGPAEAAVLFKPEVLARDGERFGALDGGGRFLMLRGMERLAKELPPVLPESGRYALFGLLEPEDSESGLALRCLSAVGELRWGNGPVCPGAGR